MSEQQRTELERLPNLLPWVVGIASVMLVGAYVWAFNELPSRESPPAWGSFGDYVGGLLNPLVSTFTLIVAVKVWQQQKVELQQTKEALEEQAKTAEQQRQEQRFFDLLALYQTTVASITLIARMSPRSEIPVQYSGKEAIAHFFRSNADSMGTVAVFLRHGFYKNGSPEHRPQDFSWLDQIPESLDQQALIDEWSSEDTSAIFDHYFRVLFRVLAESESLLGIQHFKYVKLLRAQLSRYELMLIGLNLWLDEEGKKMIPLAQRYGVLKHLPSGKLRDQLQNNLPQAVFGRRFSESNAQLQPTEETPC